MINLVRSKEHKWIFQKNISSADLIVEFLNANNRLNNNDDKSKLLDELKRTGSYKGRSSSGSISTMGVRMSEIKFYMYGYSLPQYKGKFIPSPMAVNLMKDKSKENVSKISLVNLFSMQYPHPFSNTPKDFQINSGRLIIKLLTDSSIDKKLYIDEFCYFIPFLENINENTYSELVDSILEFRNLKYVDKQILFRSVDNYNDVFSNVFHECNYYFFRLFQDLGVFKICKDEKHNEGKLFKFRHGNGKTFRTDAYASRKQCSGYIKLADNLLNKAETLIKRFSPFEKPITPADVDILSQEDYILAVYQSRPMQYLSTIDAKYNRSNEVSTIIETMVHASKYGSRDGKEFENALKPVFELFEQVVNVDIISGAGDTDLLCALRDEYDKFYKINVDGKTASLSCQALNPARLNKHLTIHGSRYCIVVSSRFASGVSEDISKYPIVAITAQSLANYCYSGYNASTTGLIDYSFFEELVQKNMGSNITNVVNNFVNNYYGIG